MIQPIYSWVTAAVMQLLHMVARSCTNGRLGWQLNCNRWLFASLSLLAMCEAVQCTTFLVNMTILHVKINVMGGWKHRAAQSGQYNSHMCPLSLRFLCLLNSGFGS